MILHPKQFTSLLLFSVLFCWFFATMVAYTTLRSSSYMEIILKGAIAGVAIWCGIGLLNRRAQVLWATVAVCIYAIFGSMVWLYHSLLLPGIYGQPLDLGLYEFLGFLYMVCGSIVIWFLLLEQTRHFLEDKEP